MIDVGGLTLPQLKASVADSFRKRAPLDPLQWLPWNIRFPSNWESSQFDFDSNPHARGVVERFWMDPTKRKINLCWAVRLGKTTLMLSLIVVQAIGDPCPMVVLWPDNQALARDIDEQVYPLLEATPIIASQLQPENQRNRHAIRFRDCRVRLASGGNKSSVSGFPARVVFKIEHDKNPTRKSSEADPSLRVESRADGYIRGVKIIEEGSPSDKEQSRAYALEQSPHVQICFQMVPCPHCKTFQTLEFEQIKWDQDANGRSDSALARKTAYYECSHCQKRIEDHHRTAMLQAGRLLIDGEKIDRRGRITGQPKVDSDTMFFRLSKLYSLNVEGWGSIASEYVEAKHAAATGRLEPLRKFWNEGLARVWDPKQRRTKAHKVARRLRADDHLQIRILPAWTSFLTMTADVGSISEQLIFYWMVIAWGSPHKVCRGAICDWGITQGKSEFLDEWRHSLYPVDGSDITAPLWGHPAAIDSSAFTAEIYEFCAPGGKRIANCFPLKADSRTNVTDFYRLGYARQGLTPAQVNLKRKMGKADLFEPATDNTQGWRQALVEGRTSQTDDGFVSLPEQVCDRWADYSDFLDELTADQLLDGQWKGQDNEFGDTLRYARALAQCYVANRYRGRWDSLPLLLTSIQTGETGRVFKRSRRDPSGGGSFVKGTS